MNSPWSCKHTEVFLHIEATVHLNDLKDLERKTHNLLRGGLQQLFGALQ